MWWTIFQEQLSFGIYFIFQGSKEFCINYKNNSHYDRCSYTIEINNDIYSPIFSLDDEDANQTDKIIFLDIDIVVIYLFILIS